MKDTSLCIVRLLFKRRHKQKKTIRFYAFRHSGIGRWLTFWSLYSTKKYNNDNTERSQWHALIHLKIIRIHIVNAFIEKKQTNCSAQSKPNWMHFFTVSLFIFRLDFRFFSDFCFYLPSLKVKKCAVDENVKQKQKQRKQFVVVFHLRLKFIICKYSEMVGKKRRGYASITMQQGHNDCRCSECGNCQIQ